MKTVFEVIQTHVLGLLAIQNCPEFAKDDMVKMIATEKALEDHLHIIATMVITCPEYREILMDTIKMLTIALEHHHNRRQGLGE